MKKNTNDKLFSEYEELKRKYDELQKLYAISLSNQSNIEGITNVNNDQCPKTINNAPLSIFEISNKGIFTFYEGMPFNNKDSKPSDMVGLSVNNVYKDHPQIIECIKKALKGNCTCEEMVIQSKAYDLMFSPIFDSNNAVTKVIGLSTDNTKSKNAEHELLILANALKCIGECVAITDMENKIIFVNSSLLKTFGYSKDELIGKKSEILLTDNSKMELGKEILQSTLNGGWHGEIINKRKDGTEFPAYLSTNIVKDKNDNIIALIGVSQDISMRKQAEEKLKESESRFSLFMDHLPALVFIKDIEGKVIYANKSMNTALGSDAWIGLNALNIFGKETAERIQKDDKKTLDLGYQRIEESFPNLKGEMHSYETQKFIIPRINQSPLLGGIAIDITERIKSELIIKKQNEQLHKLNASKDKFFSIIAHDLKSPFQGLIGFTGLLAEGIEDFTPEELNQITSEMHKTVSNLYKMLKNLLEWSQMQQGSKNFSPQIHSLNNIIKQEIDSIYLRAKQKGVSIQVNMPNKVNLFADIKMIHSVISNLLSNALKFTSKGGNILVNVKHVDNGFIEISIADNGVGMSEQLMNKLFKIEEKTGRRGTEGEESTGLGLLLCKEFVEKHGGKIWAESQEEKGSKFYFTIATKR